jgi:hypothetical protein
MLKLQTLGKGQARFLKTIPISMQRLSDSSPRCFPKDDKTKIFEIICARMFMTALFIVAPNWKSPVFINRRTDKKQLLFYTRFLSNAKDQTAEAGNSLQESNSFMSSAGHPVKIMWNSHTVKTYL